MDTDLAEYSASGASVSLDGVPGYRYAILGRSNLADWVSSEANPAPFSVVDPAATSGVRRFYRAIYVPAP